MSEAHGREGIPPALVRVLLVEDDEDDVFLFRKILGSVRGMAFEVTRAADHDGALARLAEDRHDICFLDYRLGAWDGIALMREALARGHRGPFVLLTGQSDDGVDMEALAAGAADYLSKGHVNGRALERCIRYALERDRATQSLRRARDELEVKVAQRTAKLEAAMGELTRSEARERQARAEAEALFHEAQRVNRQKDEFLALLSHELRTPLNAILGYAELLRAGDMEPAEEDEAHAIILRNAQAQCRLVEDLLDVSNIVTGKLSIETAPVAMATVVADSVAAIRRDAEAKGVRLESDVGEDRGMVEGDATRLRQVMGNLLANAIKFTPAGGYVRVSLGREGSHVAVRVADTGKGIEAAFQPYVFERFRQEDARIARTHGGLGLGLSIVRDLVVLHGGRVSVSSPGPGKGATFTVCLPAMAESGGKGAKGDAGASRQVAFHGTTLRGLRVLVVDDSWDILHFITSILGKAGADVVKALSADAALAAMAEARPDVILSDIGMPEVDGYQFMRTVRSREAAAGATPVPAAAMTAYARLEERRLALEAGFDRHIAKPVGISQLIETVLSLSARRAEAKP